MIDFDGINYAYDRGVNRALFATESHSRGASLHNQDDFVETRTNRVDRDDVAFLIFAIHAHQPRDKKLAPVKALVLARGYDCSNYSSKNHDGCRVSGVRTNRNLTPDTCLTFRVIRT